MMNIHVRYIICVIVIATINSWGAQRTLVFRGALKDSLFVEASEVRAEVLETGEVDTVAYGESFEMTLPADSTWNICFSDSIKEKCYEIKYTGVDSTFEQVIGDSVASQMLFDNTQEVVDLAVTQDTTSPAMDDENGELDSQISQAINKRTRLRSTVVRLRKRPKRALGKTTISAKAIKRMPSLAEADVIKSIQALPGVVASSDFSSKLYVRGAGSDQNLFLFDNAVVYSPIHFFGLFSTFLVEGVDEVNFYKGGFAPEYGNRLSSVVDIKSRVGGNDTTNSYFEGSSIKISTFATQVHTEGHHNGFRWLLAGRATYFKEMIDFFRYIGMTDLKVDYRFWDVQGSFDYEFNKNQHLKFSFYTGEDKLIFTPLYASWGNDIYALNYEHKDMIKNVDFYGTVSFSRFHQEFEFENISRFENSIESRESKEWLGDFFKDGYKASYKAVGRYSGIKDNTISAGFESQAIQTSFKQVLLLTENDPANEDSTAEEADSDGASAQQAQSNDANLYDFWLHSVFISDEMKFGNILITPGVRGSYHSDLKTMYFEPRISFRYNLTGNQAIDIHLGHYKQFVNSLQFSDQENLNELYYPTKKTPFKSMKPSESDMLSLGYHNPGLWSMIDLTVEGYYKVFHNLYVFDFNNAPQEVKDAGPLADLGDYFTMGEGYSYGFELMVRKNEGRIFGGVSYAYGKSVLQDLPESASKTQKDSAAYPANWDQTHSIKIDMGVNWKGEDGFWKHEVPGRYWRSSLSLKVASGLPYPAVAGYMPAHLMNQGSGWNPGGPPVTYDDNVSTPLALRNQSRYPWYTRLDIKVFDIGRTGKWSFSYTIINALNNENIFFYTYNKSTRPPTREEQTQLPFLPVMLNFEYFF